MDREAGIQAYQQLIGPEEYQRRLDAGEVENLAHRYHPPQGEAPVLRLELAKVEAMTDLVSKYEFCSVDGSPLPPFEAGAHLDVVIAPEFLRQYSLSGDPADRSRYQIAVLKEDQGRGGSRLLHQIFSAGRKVFVSRPINHFPLIEMAHKTLLMGGGIGITPMLAMAHRLHAIGADFELHYSCRSRDSAGFLQDLANAPWAHRVSLHVSAEGTRAELGTIFAHYKAGQHCYTCGPNRYMTSVLDTARQLGWPEEAMHYEYFSVPESPDYENHNFTLTLARSGRRITVTADQSAADALIASGVPVDLKCSDGLCGVCKCELLDGEVEHRDHVLSKAQRQHAIILCQSRAASPGGEVVINL
jgi:ferredoxin-NADP reductase